VSCCGQKTNPLYDYQVTLPDGTKKVFATKPEARIAIAAAGGGTMKYVKKAS
jgi:hypothetical protein